MTFKQTEIAVLPIDAIVVANPRSRNIKSHHEITDSIGDVGLKRPITVRRTGRGSSQKYALVCGQGRLESCKLLGQTEIPALIIEATEETGHIMSLVENIARRTPRPSEMMEQVSVLHSRGYSAAEIGEKIGCGASWVSMVLTLLDKGERRLLAAAEAGKIPLSLAVSISRSSAGEAQALLLEAYERKELNGRNVATIRRMLDRRLEQGKGLYSKPGTKASGKTLTPEGLAELYRRDSENHKRIQKRAEATQGALALAKQIFKELLSDSDFRSLVKKEGLGSFPPSLGGTLSGTSE